MSGSRQKREGAPKSLLTILERHGIRYYIIDGELYLDGRQTERILTLCDEGKLPKEICG